MAIAPIDLQTMYAQMGHLAKVAAEQQNGSHFAQQMQEARRIQQDAERAVAVKKTAGNESKTMIVGKDGRRGGQQEFEEQKSDEKQKEEPEQKVKKIQEIRESHLGNRVSIES